MCVDLERWLIWVLGSEDVLGMWRLVDGRVSFRSCFLVSLATSIGKGKDCWSFHNGLCKQVCSVINHLKLGISSFTRNQTLKFDSSISSSIYHRVNPLYQEIILVSSCKRQFHPSPNSPLWIYGFIKLWSFVLKMWLMTHWVLTEDG